MRVWRRAPGAAIVSAMATNTDLALPDALVREVDWVDPGRLAAALEARGASQ